MGRASSTEVFPGLMPGGAEHSKRRTSSGDQGGRECEKRVHTLDIHPEALRFIGKDA